MYLVFNFMQSSVRRFDVLPGALEQFLPDAPDADVKGASFIPSIRSHLENEAVTNIPD